MPERLLLCRIILYENDEIIMTWFSFDQPDGHDHDKLSFSVIGLYMSKSHDISNLYWKDIET